MALTVGDMISLLEQYPNDMRVFVASDDEWNSVKNPSGIVTSYTSDPDQYEVEVADANDINAGQFTEVLVVW